MAATSEAVLPDVKPRDRVQTWVDARHRLDAKERSGDYPTGCQWHDSDEEATEIVRALADLLGVKPARTVIEHKTDKGRSCYWSGVTLLSTYTGSHCHPSDCGASGFEGEQ